MDTNTRTLRHVSNVITSIDKCLKKVYLGKPFKTAELYLYDTIFNFIEGCHIELTNDQIRKLTTMYNRLPSLSDQICNSLVKETFQTKPRFIQAESNDVSNNGTPYKIYYWQDDDVSNSTTDIYDLTLTTNFFKDKPSLVYNTFNEGVRIEYTTVGKIAFEIINSGDKVFKIYDVLRNDVTDGFQRFYNPTTKNITFVSVHNYAHANIEFKIK